MRASKAMADRASSHPKVQVHYNTAVEDAFGSSVLEVSRFGAWRTSLSDAAGFVGG
jgi:thioredoxin reductase